MPTLEEIRNWLEGKSKEGDPKREGKQDLSKKVKIRSINVKCKTCGGDGKIRTKIGFVTNTRNDVWAEKTCEDCRGSGKIEINTLLEPKLNKKGEEEFCRDCQGRGVNIFGDKCSSCGGRGTATYEKRTLECSNCYGTGTEPFTGAKCEICGGEGEIEFDARKDAVGLAKRLTQISRSKGRYKISEKGDDALLKFGKHKGRTLTEVSKKEPTYLKWIITDNFPEDIKDICRYILNTKKKVR